MPIKISPGPGGDNSLLVALSGVSTEQSTATNYFNFHPSIYAQLAPGLPDHVEIVNVPATDANGFTVRRIGPLHYSDWRDRDDNSFSSALEVISYVTDLIATLDISTERLTTSPAARSTTSLVVGAGNPLSYKHTHPAGVSYFWSESTVPSDLSISNYDNRIVSGVINTPGIYILEVEVANAIGITTDSIEITVV